ncbi:hypothetical protein EMIT0P253_130048 [Pseudomonas sp. IT-P253]
MSYLNDTPQVQELYGRKTPNLSAQEHGEQRQPDVCQRHCVGLDDRHQDVDEPAPDDR